MIQWSRVNGNREMILRRSRGYAPRPIKTASKFVTPGPGLWRGTEKYFLSWRAIIMRFVSHHIGDLENLETLRSFTDGIEHFKRLFHLQPEVVAYDLHPEYLSTKYALGAR